MLPDGQQDDVKDLHKLLLHQRVARPQQALPDCGGARGAQRGGGVGGGMEKMMAGRGALQSVVRRAGTQAAYGSLSPRLLPPLSLSPLTNHLQVEHGKQRERRLVVGGELLDPRRHGRQLAHRLRAGGKRNGPSHHGLDFSGQRPTRAGWRAEGQAGRQGGKAGREPGKAGGTQTLPISEGTRMVMTSLASRFGMSTWMSREEPWKRAS